MENDTPEEEAGTPPAPEPSQEPKRSEKEKAEFSLRKNAERLKELGGDPNAVLGTPRPITWKPEESLPDDTPLTVGTFREIQKQDARQTAEQLANAIVDEAERERTLSELKYVVPSGDAEADFRRAQSSANAERNAKIAEEAERRSSPRITASGTSAAVAAADEFVPTPEEAALMAVPLYGMTKEKVLEARKRSQERLAQQLGQQLGQQP